MPRPIKFKCGCVYNDEDTDGETSWSYLIDATDCNQEHGGGLMSMPMSAIDYGGEYVDPITTPTT